MAVWKYFKVDFRRFNFVLKEFYRAVTASIGFEIPESAGRPGAVLANSMAAFLTFLHVYL